MSASYPDPTEFEMYIINAATEAGWLGCSNCDKLSPADAMGFQIDNHSCNDVGAVSITLGEFIADRLELDNWGTL